MCQCGSICDNKEAKRVYCRQSRLITNQLFKIKCADVAQLAEQLICNQQVIGSSPIIGLKINMGGFPSGQRGQTVNLLQIASVVRIHLHPLDSGNKRIETI